MELSKNTLDIFKNFANLNTNIFVGKDQSRVATISESGDVVGEANIEEEFPVDFGILNLNRFLSVVGTFQTPTFDFSSDRVIIQEKDNTRKRFQYVFTDKSCLTTFDKKVNFPEAQFSFTLEKTVLDELQNASRIGHLPDLRVKTTDDTVELTLMDMTNPATNSFTVELEGEGVAVNTVFKMEKLRIISTGYDVFLTEKAAKFVSKDYDLTYYVSRVVQKKKAS